MRSKILLLAVFICPVIIYSQDIYTLSGQVQDPDKQAVAAGDISILNKDDSAVVKATDIARGQFKFEPVPKGQYLLKITSMGFKIKFELLNLDESKTITINLERSTAMLQQVSVVGEKKTFINKNGNITVNVESSPLASVADAMTLLSKVPMVQVSPDGESLSVLGKGQPLIYIDNQKMTVDDLKSLVVADIKTIEVVNNPPSKYEAEGRVVLLITRKTNRSDGWKGELSETAAYRRYYLNRTGANVSVKKRKLELKGNIQYNQLKTWEGNAFDMKILDHQIDTRYSVTAVTTRPQFVADAGGYYQIKEGDYISLSGNVRTQNESFPIFTNSSLQDATRNEQVLTTTYNRNPNLYHTTRLNYNHKAGTSNLFVGLQQTGYDRDMHTTIYNNYDQTENQLSQARKQRSHIGVIAGRIDFEKTLHDSLRWELGAAATNASSKGQTTITGDPANNSDATYHYHENNLAVYTQLSGKLKKLQWSAGLRSETTRVLSTYADNQAPSEIRKNYTGLFPKASLTIPADSAGNITMNYSRSIIRPDYSNANQTAVYINPYFEWANNINLNPAYTNEVSINYQYHNYSVGLSAYRSEGAVYDRFEFDESKTILRRIETNYDYEKGMQLTLTAPFTIGRWTSTNVLAGVFSTIRDSSVASSKARPYMYAYTNDEFKLPGSFILSLSGWVVSKSYSGAFERNALFAVDTSLTKTFSKKLNCTLRLSDVFKSINSEQKFVVNNVAASGIFYDREREISVALKYSFGKLKESKFQSKDVDDNSNRVK